MRNEGVVLNRIGLIRLSVKLEVQTTSVRKGSLADDSAGPCCSRVQGFNTICKLIIKTNN